MTTKSNPTEMLRPVARRTRRKVHRWKQRHPPAAIRERKPPRTTTKTTMMSRLKRPSKTIRIVSKQWQAMPNLERNSMAKPVPVVSVCPLIEWHNWSFSRLGDRDEAAGAEVDELDDEDEDDEDDDGSISTSSSLSNWVFLSSRFPRTRRR